MFSLLWDLLTKHITCRKEICCMKDCFFSGQCYQINNIQAYYKMAIISMLSKTENLISGWFLPTNPRWPNLLDGDLNCKMHAWSGKSLCRHVDALTSWWLSPTQCRPAWQFSNITVSIEGNCRLFPCDSKMLSGRLFRCWNYYAPTLIKQQGHMFKTLMHTYFIYIL